MRIKIIFLLIVFSQIGIVKGQLIQFEFNGTGACPTQDNVPVFAPPANLTVSAITRVGAMLTCVSSTDGFASSGFGSVLDLNSYVELTLTADPGYYLNISSMYFMVMRVSSSTALTGMVAHDGTGSFSTTMEYPILTSNSTINWTGFSPFSSSSGGAVRFRFYGWNASSNYTPPGTGSVRLDKITVFGSVTTLPMSGLWTSVTAQDITNTNPGSIGIGTATPNTGAKLDVNGNIFSNGKLLLGTTDLSPLNDYSLAVNGNAIFNKIKIKSYATWPDYVFEDNYDLPSLAYIEYFIKKNKHLPGVASSKEVKINGIDIELQQAKLLEKIEELTLYILDLNKRLEFLELENRLLKQRIKTIIEK